MTQWSVESALVNSHLLSHLQLECSMQTHTVPVAYSSVLNQILESPGKQQRDPTCSEHPALSNFALTLQVYVRALFSQNTLALEEFSLVTDLIFEAYQSVARYRQPWLLLEHILVSKTKSNSPPRHRFCSSQSPECPSQGIQKISFAPAYWAIFCLGLVLFCSLLGKLGSVVLLQVPISGSETGG